MHRTTRTVQEVLRRKAQPVISIAPDESVYAALGRMAAYDIGCLVVLDGERLCGIFSERDYARQVALLGRTSRDTAVRDIMTHRVLCVRPEQTVDDCMGLMTTRRVRHLPVVDHKRVVGLVSIGDVVHEVIADQRGLIEQLESYIHS